MGNKANGNQTNKDVKEHQEDEMGNVASRRKALKKIAIGGTLAVGASSLPSQWAKPIVDEIMVPAHAQTSPPPRTTQDPCSYFISCYFVEPAEEEELRLEFEGTYECPEDVDPDDLTGVMVDITVLDSSPSNWPCPGNTSVALDSEAKASGIVFPCDGFQRDPDTLEIKVEFQDKTKWGTASSTCVRNVPA